MHVDKVSTLVKKPSSPELVSLIERLSELVDDEVRQTDGGPFDERRRPDLVLESHGETFVVEFKRASSSASIAGATQQLRSLTAGMPGAIPLLAVPHMTPAAGEIAARAGVSWLDLSGNAHIRTPRMLIRIEGRPNLHPRHGRPASPFSPKASRIARWFLMHPGRQTTRGDLAAETAVDPGQVSRVVRVLLDELLLRQQGDAMLYCPNPAILLDAWRAEYRFDRHQAVAGHVPGRSGQDVLQRLSSMFEAQEIEYAATGLAGAWLLTKFASFRLATVFAASGVPRAALESIGFSPESRGANVWIVYPNDVGVFVGAEDVDGVRCAHPLQVYLDLVGHPERAPEAADELLPRVLGSGL